MIEMKCPSCGAVGRVPREKINHRLTGKRCLRVFHLSPAVSTLGSAPLQGRPKAPRAATPRVMTPRRRSMTSHPNSPRSESPPFRPGCGDGARCGLGRRPRLLVLFTIVHRGGAPSCRRGALKKPENMKEVIDLAAAGTEMDAIKWYNDAYKRFADLSVALGARTPA